MIGFESDTQRRPCSQRERSQSHSATRKDFALAAQAADHLKPRGDTRAKTITEDVA